MKTLNYTLVVSTLMLSVWGCSAGPTVEETAAGQNEVKAAAHAASSTTEVDRWLAEVNPELSAKTLTSSTAKTLFFKIVRDSHQKDVDGVIQFVQKLESGLYSSTLQDAFEKTMDTKLAESFKNIRLLASIVVEDLDSVSPDVPGNPFLPLDPTAKGRPSDVAGFISFVECRVVAYDVYATAQVKLSQQRFEPGTDAYWQAEKRLDDALVAAKLLCKSAPSKQ